MDTLKIEKKYPELTGLDYKVQQRILKSVRQKTHPWKYGFIGLSIAFVIGIIYHVTIQRFILPPEGGAEMFGYVVLGVIGGCACERYYRWQYKKILRQKIKELIRDEKQNGGGNGGFVSGS